jgi:hypothetical protein
MGTRHKHDRVGQHRLWRDGAYFEHQVARCQTWTACRAQNGPSIHVIEGGPQLLRENQPNQIGIERFLANASKEAIIAINHENRSGSPVARKRLDNRGKRILGMVYGWREVHQATEFAHRPLPWFIRLAACRGRR